MKYKMFAFITTLLMMCCCVSCSESISESDVTSDITELSNTTESSDETVVEVEEETNSSSLPEESVTVQESEVVDPVAIGYVYEPTDGLSDSEKLEEFYSSILISSIPVNEINEFEYLYSGTASDQIENVVSGVLSHSIEDLDRDGYPEMIVVYCEEYSSQEGRIHIMICSIVDDKVEITDDYPVTPYGNPKIQSFCNLAYNPQICCDHKIEVIDSGDHNSLLFMINTDGESFSNMGFQGAWLMSLKDGKLVYDIAAIERHPGTTDLVFDEYTFENGEEVEHKETSVDSCDLSYWYKQNGLENVDGKVLYNMVVELDRIDDNSGTFTLKIW